MKEILIVGGFAGMWAALTAAHETAQAKGEEDELAIRLVSRGGGQEAEADDQRVRIYPPQGDRQAILDAAQLDARPHGDLST